MANILESMDPTKWNVDVMSYTSTIATWASILIWVALVFFGLWMLKGWLEYRIPVEIFEKRGNAIVSLGNKRAKIREKDKIEEYVILWNWLGLIPKFQEKYLKEFKINSPEHTIARSSKVGYCFKLLKQGNSFSPVTVANPDVELKIVPQDNLSWLAHKIVQIKERYNEKKWWEPYIFPMSIVVVAVICFLMIIMTLDKVSGIQQFCGAAERSLTDKFMQSIK